MNTPRDYPREEDSAPDQLADDHDELDWDVDRLGRMREHATDDVPPTIPWED